jgi:hypothetical protein
MTSSVSKAPSFYRSQLPDKRLKVIENDRGYFIDKNLCAFVNRSLDRIDGNNLAGEQEINLLTP